MMTNIFHCITERKKQKARETYQHCRMQEDLSAGPSIPC